MLKKILVALVTSVLLFVAGFAGLMYWRSGHGQQVGEVVTSFHLTGSDTISIESYDDPLVPGVTCYVSRAVAGGIKGTLGLAEDRTEASIACRQVGPMSFPKPLPKQGDVFTERMSVLFKKLHVLRVVDPARNVLVYMTYSDKLVDGSAKNSLTAVPVPRETPILVER